MKNLFIILLLSTSSVLTAQSEYNYQGRSYRFFGTEDIVYLVPAEKNKTVTIKTTYPKRKKVYHYEKSFNEFGKMTETKKIKDGEKVLTSSNIYNANGKLLRSKRFKKGKLKGEYKYERNSDGKRTAYESRNGKGKLFAKSIWEYMPNGKCLKNSVSYRKDGTTIQRKWDYEYYGDCEKKQSVLTNKKGKVIKTWTYDCKKEGEELTKKKDVNQVCKWEETDDNYLTKVQQNFDEKGRVVKMISKYRIADTALVSYKRYNSDNELTYENAFNPDTKQQLYYKYYKNGKLRSENTYEYNGDKITSYAWARKGKVRSKSEYVYNSNNELVEMKSFDKKMKQKSLTTVAYN